MHVKLLIAGLFSVAALAILPRSAEAELPPTGAGSSDIVTERVVTGPSGLPVPRFVALKKDEVLARFGPSFDYPVAYEFRREGLPLKVIAEDRDNIWRRVEDRDGRRMWIHRSMLAPNEHGIVAKADAILRSAPRADAPGRARLTSGVMARIETCEDGWCRLRAGEYRGWVQAQAIWGVPN